MNMNKIEPGDVVEVVFDDRNDCRHPSSYGKLFIVEEISNSGCVKIEDPVGITFWLPPSVKLIMKREALEALEQSIDLYDKGKYTIGSSSCPLCKIFSGELGCSNCPVGIATKARECSGSPWVELKRHCNEEHDSQSYPYTCPTCRELQNKERDYLISLHPFKEKYMKKEDKPRIVDNLDLTLCVPCELCSAKRNSSCLTPGDCPKYADLVAWARNLPIKDEPKAPCKKQPKFAVGQWVKVIGKDCDGFWEDYLIAEYHEGYDTYTLKMGNSLAHSFPENWLELAPEQTFKVGDKIKNPVTGNIYMICYADESHETSKARLVQIEGDGPGCLFSMFRSIRPTDDITLQQMKDYVNNDSWLVDGRFVKVP